jgi:hypothetical protein
MVHYLVLTQHSFWWSNALIEKELMESQDALLDKEGLQSK